jgi:hypothetical protein
VAVDDGRLMTVTNSQRKAALYHSFTSHHVTPGLDDDDEILVSSVGRWCCGVLRLTEQRLRSCSLLVHPSFSGACISMDHSAQQQQHPTKHPYKSRTTTTTTTFWARLAGGRLVVRGMRRCCCFDAHTARTDVALRLPVGNCSCGSSLTTNSRNASWWTTTARCHPPHPRPSCIKNRRRGLLLTTIRRGPEARRRDTRSIYKKNSTKDHLSGPPPPSCQLAIALRDWRFARAPEINQSFLPAFTCTSIL